MTLRGIATRMVLALCLAVGIAAQTAFVSPPAMAAADDANAVVRVVSAFYRNYIEAHRHFDGKKMDYDFRKQPEVDASFVQKIDKLIADAQKSEFGALEYDPILMAQDVPVGMKYAKPVIKESSAKLIAYTLWGGGPEHAICVSLAKKDSGWHITDVTDIETEKMKQECGGTKAKGKAQK